MDLGEGFAVLSDSIEIPVVVPKDDVNVFLIALAEFIDDEWGTEIAVANQRFCSLKQG